MCLECNPEIPVAPGEEHWLLDTSLDEVYTVEGSGKMIVTNTLGQTILTREIDGKATIELPRGLYFVKLGGAARKVVVE